MPNLNSENKNLSLSSIEEFYIPHPNADFLDVQDVIHSLLNQSISTSFATRCCFEDSGELNIDPSIVFDLIWSVQTKLEMIEKILPLAFENKQGDK